MEFKAILYGLASALAWGAGDFGGGVASRRANTYTVVIWSDVIAMFTVGSIALFTHEPMLTPHDAWLALACGLCGGLGILLLYESFTAGKMSVAAPVSALTAGALPVLVGIFNEGLPALTVIAGILLALLAIWLVARQEDTSLKFDWVSIRGPLISGIFFALFFILTDKVQGSSALWFVVYLRISAIAILVAIGLLKKVSLRPPLKIWYFLIYIGIFDMLGNLFFVLASRAGRLDVSSVLASLYPGATVVLAWIFLNEHISKWQRVGIACALVAIVLIAL